MPEVNYKLYKVRVRNKIYDNASAHWRFTQEERENYRFILKDFADDESIRDFLFLLEDYCRSRDILEKHGIYKKQGAARKILKNIVKDAGELLDALKDIQAGFNFALPYNVEEIKNASISTHIREKAGIEDPSWLFNKEMRSAADCVIEPLSRFIETAKNIETVYSKDKTKKHADKSGLIQAIGRLYLMYIGKPSTTKTGPFAGIIELTLGYLDLPCKSPGRAIGPALKSLKKNYPNLYSHHDYLDHRTPPLTANFNRRLH